MLRALRDAVSQSKAPVCDTLAAHVPRLYDENAGAARVLINVKRDLFNERPPTPAVWERIRPHLSPACRESADALVASLRELAVLTAASAVHHATELESAYEAAVRVCSEPNLIHALALTNPPVHARLQHVLAGKPVSHKERVQLCTSLGRYVLRAGQKTSPLSSFGVVALGSWGGESERPDGNDALALPTTIERRLQPRYAALDYVFLELLDDVRRIDGAAPIALNTSLRVDNGEYAWAKIKNDDAPESRVRGARVAQHRSRAALVKLLDWIFSACEPGGTPTLDQLRDALRPAVGGDAVRADELLATAWGHSLIRPALPAGTDPVAWARVACACCVAPLRDVVSSALERFVAAVASTDRLDQGYTATVERRFEELLLSAGVAIPVARFRPIVFEDCSLPAPAFELPRAFLRRHEPELVALLRLIPILVSNTPLAQFRRLAVRRFRERYGAGGVSVDVRDFIETCADEFDALFTGDNKGEKSSAFAELATEDSARNLAHLRRKMFKGLARLAANDGDVVLNVADLDRYVAKIKSGAPPATSKMFFVQPVDTPDGRLLAVNHIYPGASCTFSRFIPDDEHSIGKVRDYLRAIAEDGRFVELGGIFGFNANLHATLADQVIAIPPFAPVAGNAGSLDTMRLRHRAGRDDLVFEDAHGRPVNIFFLGILTPLLMPRTYQVVRTLCFSSDRVEDIGDQLTNYLAPDAGGAIVVPRVRVGRLVLVRRSLAVRKADLPDPALDDFAFFEAFAHWADGRDLPRWLFSRRTAIPALHRGTGMRLPDWRSLPGKDAKPMPLDRECPLAVRIFQKNLAVSELDVVFVEALPDPTQACFAQGGHAVVGEFGIELTLKEDA